MKANFRFYAESDLPLVLKPQKSFLLLTMSPYWLMVMAFLAAGLWLHFVFMAAGLVFILPAGIKSLSLGVIRYTITKEQIKVRSGVLSRHYDYLELFRVKDYRVEQSPGLRLLGLANIELISSDMSKQCLVLQGIPDSNLPDLIRELIIRSRIRNHVLEF